MHLHQVIRMLAIVGYSSFVELCVVRTLIEYFFGLFILMRSIWYEDTIKIANDNWFIDLFSLRESA